MFNLAIECSAFSASVALCHQEGVVVERKLPDSRGAIETLAPAIDDITREVSVGLISITSGPGSFTGLRIGLATAKMLAMAWRIPVAPVDTLDVIAEQQRLALVGCSQVPASIVITGVDAFRGQVFSSAWLFERDSNWRCLAGSQVVNATEWMENPIRVLDNPNLREASLRVRQCLVSGPVLEKYPVSQVAELPGAPRLSFCVSPAEQWVPRASTVGQLGWQAFQEKRVVFAQRLQPNYLRASAAEEKSRGLRLN